MIKYFHFVLQFIMHHFLIQSYLISNLATKSYILCTFAVIIKNIFLYESYTSQTNKLK